MFIPKLFVAYVFLSFQNKPRYCCQGNRRISCFWVLQKLHHEHLFSQFPVIRFSCFHVFYFRFHNFQSSGFLVFQSSGNPKLVILLSRKIVVYINCWFCKRCIMSICFTIPSHPVFLFSCFRFSFSQFPVIRFACFPVIRKSKLVFRVLQKLQKV